MSTRGRIILAFLLVILFWVITYYRACAPVLREINNDGTGIQLEDGDTIGEGPMDLTGSDPRTDPERNPPDTDPDPGPDAADDRVVLPDPNRPRINDPTIDGNGEDGPRDNNDPAVIPPPPPTTDYTVGAGDTMESIAKSWFGDHRKWIIISQENPLVDPMRLRTGQVLRLPPRTARIEDVPADVVDQLTRGTVYIVKEGDTLSGIASKFYGKSSLYDMIFDANRDQLSTPNDLRLGQHLKIPPYQRPAD